MKSAVFENNFIIVQNGKIRFGAPKTCRKIPICPSLRALMPEILSHKHKYNVQALGTEFKKFCPSHTLHDLRHTFTTRARESGIDKGAVDFITGHKSNDMTESVYTHYTDEFLLKQIEKLDY